LYEKCVLLLLFVWNEYIFMPVKVFLLGRPGSGKSTAYHAIARHLKQKHQDWSLTRINEYAILYEMFLADNENKKFSSIEYDGFDVLDFSVLDEASLKLEKNIQQNMSFTTNGKLLIIEFARSDYSEAFKLFKGDLLRDSYFLFVESDVETCIQRIHERILRPAKADNHFVSDNILRGYYQKDNLHYMASTFKTDYNISKKVEVIYNKGSIQAFVEQINQFIDLILNQESDNIIATGL
jgi:thymidylate kinase